MGKGFHILRVGVAVTFLWIGILILQDPISWSGFIQPWVRNFLPESLVPIMVGTAFFDILVGALLLIDTYTWLAAAAAAIHLVTVLIVSGINQITIRDVGLLAASLTLLVESLPQSVVSKFLRLKS